MNKLTCFKTYDIRGKLGDELNEDIAYRIGRAYAQYLKPRHVVVGGDARETSSLLKKAVAQGLLDEGVDVFDIGLAGTEEIYFSTFYYQFDGGIEITASHNPINYNGMKLVTQNAKPLSRNSGLSEIQAIAEANAFSSINPNQKGEYKPLNIQQDYLNHLLSYIDVTQIQPLKIVINAGNGAAGHVIDNLENHFVEKNIPIELIKIHNEPDSRFPHGIPNPLLPECREDTRKAVIEYNADLGVAFDGDFDRCFFFDQKGNFIEGYYIVGLLAEAFLQKESGATIIHDPRLIWNTQDKILANNGKAFMSQTGHAFIKENMRAENAIYGGEMSAHHYFREFSYCDSGMIPWLLIIELISHKKTSLGKLLNECMRQYPSSGEINITLTNANEKIARIFEFYQNEAKEIDRLDGLSMAFENWRFNLRQSNTEPLIRLNIETRGDEALVKQKTDEILKMLKA